MIPGRLARQFDPGGACLGVHQFDGVADIDRDDVFGRPWYEGDLEQTVEVVDRGNGVCTGEERLRVEYSHPKFLSAQSAQFTTGFWIGDHRALTGAHRKDHTVRHAGVGAAIDDQRVVILDKCDLSGDRCSGHDAANELPSRSTELEPALMRGRRP